MKAGDGGTMIFLFSDAESFILTRRFNLGINFKIFTKKKQIPDFLVCIILLLKSGIKKLAA